MIKKFNYIGGTQTFVVPAGVTEITADLIGASGGGTPGNFGKGGQVTATFPVTEGQQIYILVGQVGSYVAGSAVGRPAKVGGGGGTKNVPTGGSSGASGGGGTDIRIGGTGLGSRVLIAGGGGGMSGGGINGGDGGANTGQNGADGFGGTTGGTGGGTSSGGTGGTGGVTGGNGGGGVSGTGGIGGAGANPAPRGGGGGGGGHYGGGGGGGDDTAGSGGGGGGGSNFVAATINGSAPTSVTNARGVGGTAQVSLTYNLPPNQPTLNTPISGVNIDPALALDFMFTFSDGDPGDTCSAADFQYRTGAGAWTSVPGVAIGSLGHNQYEFTEAATTFTALTDDTVEWQVRTYDAASAVGPWSASSYFIPRTAPATPTITPAPVIDSNEPTVAWTTPASMVAYQVRVLNDVAGSPGTLVRSDTGIVPVMGGPSAGTLTLPSYPYVSGTSYHVQVRYQHDVGVWSAWADSGAIVADINAPLAPTLTLTPSTVGNQPKVTIAITNPGGDSFPPDHNDIYRSSVDRNDDEIRIKAGVALNGSYDDYLVGINETFRYRVAAVRSTGAFTFSA